MSQLRSKPNAKAPPPENFLATGGRFERNTFLVMALDWLKKEDERYSDFWPFQVCRVYVAITTVDWGKPFKLLCVLLDASICSPGDDIAVKTLIH